MTKLRLTAVITVLVVPLLLGGCSNQAYGIAALDAKAGPGDVLPGDVELPFPEEIDEATVRLLAENDGRQYFGARSADGVLTCVSVVSIQQEFDVAGCGVTTGPDDTIITVSGPDGKSTRLVRDNADAERLESEGLRRIHQNVYVAKQQMSLR